MTEVKPDRLLALDLATKTGWVVREGGSIDSGVWNLKGDKFEGGGMRFLRFRTLLIEVLGTGISRVAYEAVRRHMGVDAAHIYGALMGIVQEECERRQIPYCGVTVSSIKIKATGKGNANKDAMVDAAKRQWPLIEIIDDNHADALWISEVAKSTGAPR